MQPGKGRFAVAKMTVLFDGQFWVGVCERRDEAGCSAYRHVFGAEPADETVREFVARGWERLPFSRAVADDGAFPVPTGNPKRRKRMAARETAARGVGTKAQQALAAERELAKREGRAASREERRERERRLFEHKRLARKQKRRGH